MKNILVIFGATGDLMDRKISPSLFELFQKHKTSLERVIGFGRRELTDAEFRSQVAESVTKKLSPAKEDIDLFLQGINYHIGMFDNLEDYKALKKKLNDFDSHLFYLAVPPEKVTVIVKNLGESGIFNEKSKLMVEKPVGNNFKTSSEIEEVFDDYLSENQIYRIDHYLGKQSVRKILEDRFFNLNEYKGKWNKDYIQSIEIKLLETLGVENRGAFYDQLGTLRDVGQNHVLQILALLTMKRPKEVCCKQIRDERENLLQKLECFGTKEVKERTYRAQYNGYLSIPGVNSSSKTETYFKIKTFLETPEWKSVPIFLESGKKMKRVNKEAKVNFKDGSSLTFTIEESGSSQYVVEYVQLFNEFIAGDQTYFLSREEQNYMWHFIDPIVDGWSRGENTLNKYTAEQFNGVQNIF